MDNNLSSTWYKEWFNSPYYHILYKNRDEKEAELFIDNLLKQIQLPKNALIEDVCCGKGRHSVYLNKKGYEVTGIDLSEESIKYASQFENDKLSFFVHDMRKLFRINYFDAAFNLFTSFGYFENQKEEIQALNAITKGLKKNGILVIDYFNTEKILRCLPLKETKIIDGIKFKIDKKKDNGFITKRINVEDKNQMHSFVEKVRLLNQKDFEQLFDTAGFKLISTFGDYNLSAFDKKNSDRLILIGIKQ